jgi:hypothetical protein
MREIVDHFLLQKEPGRASTYRQLPPIWWSEQALRWFVTNPELIREIMHDRAFSVPDYNVQAIIDRLDVDLSGLMKTREHLPLAWEGEKHKALRNWMTRLIAANSGPSSEIFQDQFRARLAKALPKGRFCFVQDLVKPAMRATILRMSGYPDPFDPDIPEIEITPHFFDDRISLRKRKQINEVIHAIAGRLPPEMADEEKYAVVAIINVSSNTLLATLTQSVLQVLWMNPDTPSSDMNWNVELPATGLPLIEKVCLRVTEVRGHTIRPGDRLRLFIETEGLSDGPVSRYSDLFFATGPHRCSGMAFSRQIWTILGDEMRRVELKFRVLQTSERQHDYVFNFLEKLEVETHA